jgi:HSP20 family protein
MGNRYDPVERMERMFDQMRRSVSGGYDPFFGSESDETTWSAADINLSLETDEEGYVVLADLPGFEREDLDLRFDDGVLTILGEHDVAEEGERGWQHRRRHVSEQLRIPGEVVVEDISASYRNGVLEVHLPTAGEIDEDAHRIDID